MCNFHELNRKSKIHIIDYKKSLHSEAVLKLFSAIYPDWTYAKLHKMDYDENAFRHVCTKLLTVNDNVAGQVNIFMLSEKNKIANLGYHVHPDYRKYGFAYQLCMSGIENCKKISR